MKISLFLKIFIPWITILSLMGATLVAFPHRDISPPTLLIVSITLLVAIVSLAIVLKEKVNRNKPLFVNFALFFGFWLHSWPYLFVGHLFLKENPFSGFYIYQYGSNAIAYFLLALAIVYAVIDTLFSQYKIFQKYLLTLLIVGGTFTYYYYPIFENPKYLYQTADIQDFKEVSHAITTLREQGIENPSVEQIALAVNLPAWKGETRVGTLFEDAERARIAELLPYINGDNILVLVFKPLYSNIIYMNILCLVFLLMFFGYQYKNDPPQGAYIEKILFLFLPYCSLEILHYFSYIKSVELSAYLQLYDIGVYLMAAVLLGLLLFFSLRLRFITSVTGTFYEQELVSDPEHITRWRDRIDGFIVRHFLNPQTLHGRFLAPRAPKAEP